MTVEGPAPGAGRTQAEHARPEGGADGVETTRAPGWRPPVSAREIAPTRRESLIYLGVCAAMLPAAVIVAVIVSRRAPSDDAWFLPVLGVMPVLSLVQAAAAIALLLRSVDLARRLPRGARGGACLLIAAAEAVGAWRVSTWCSRGQEMTGPALHGSAGDASRRLKR